MPPRPINFVWPQSAGARSVGGHDIGFNLIAVPRQRRDPELHRDVRAELGIQPDDGRRSVEITVHQGVVYLTGFVESAAEKRAIDRVVRRVAGVKGLRNYLHVRPP